MNANILPHEDHQTAPLKKTGSWRYNSIIWSESTRFLRALIERQKRAEVQVVKDKVLVRAPFHKMPDSNSVGHGLGIRPKGNTKRRPTEQFPKKYQTIYKKDDIRIDDVTASEMKDMVRSFDNCYRRQMDTATRCAFFGILGLILAIIQREIYWQSNKNIDNDEVTIANVTVTLLRFAVSITTVMTLDYNMRYHKALFTFQVLSKNYLKRKSLSTRIKSSKMFIFESIMWCIHEPPFLDIFMNISIGKIYDPCNRGEVKPAMLHNPWGLLIILRLWLMVRYIRVTYYSGGTQILGMWHHFKFTLPFTIRAILHSYPFKSLGPIFLGTTAIGSYLLYVCERAAEHGNIHTFLDALWSLCITMTTVGYGDLVPATWLGRLICIMISLVYMVFSAALIATVHQKLCLMPYESRMVEFLEHATSVKQLKNKGAAVIQAAWKLYRKKREQKDTNVSMYAQRIQVMNRIKDFDRYRHTVQTHDRRYRNDQLVRSMLEDISRQFQEAKMYFSAANKIAAETGISLGFDRDVQTYEKRGHFQHPKPQRTVLRSRSNPKTDAPKSTSGNVEMDTQLTSLLLKEIKKLKSEVKLLKEKI